MGINSVGMSHGLALLSQSGVRPFFSPSIHCLLLLPSGVDLADLLPPSYPACSLLYCNIFVCSFTQSCVFPSMRSRVSLLLDKPNISTCFTKLNSQYSDLSVSQVLGGEPRLGQIRMMLGLKYIYYLLRIHALQRHLIYNIYIYVYTHIHRYTCIHICMYTFSKHRIINTFELIQPSL